MKRAVASTNEIIDFNLLDDVLLAPRNRSDEIMRVLTARGFDSIGPAVEYAFQQLRFPHLLPTLAVLPESEVIAALQSAMNASGNSQHLADMALNPRRTEFAMLRFRSAGADGAGWTAFLKRLQGAARQAGFGNLIAAGIVGAVRELVENLDIHSEAPDSGIVGYAFSDDSFEFVIADSGIGLLDSLRPCPDYAHLDDHGDALLTALTDGESRFGRNKNHGHGFRQLFVALADLYGSLRFRSGDHRLEIMGNSPNLPTATVSQTAIFQGFMAWVACRPAFPKISA